MKEDLNTTQRKKNAKKLLKLVELAEGLKTEKRNSRTSRCFQESVADHCWRVALMVLFFHPFLDQKIQLEKALKMALLHDLPEILTGDHPFYIYEENQEMKNEKHESEKIAIGKITKNLPKETKSEIIKTWEEYEENSSLEAKFVKALDKMEAQIQHNQTDFSFWNKHDLKHKKRLDSFCGFDSFLNTLKVLIQEATENKINNK